MNKYFLWILVFSFNTLASETHVPTAFGRIVDLKGSGFISSHGKTREMRKGDVIEMGSEMVIEHLGLVSFTDNADHRFHMGNSSSISVTANTLELRGGDLWFQSLNKNDEYKIKTANALINYEGGEGILTYDSVRGKTQLMVINGMMKLSNIRAPGLNLSVSEGQFSFIDNAYEEGAPRDPTPVGEKTYRQLVALFNGVVPMDKRSALIFKNNKNEHEATTLSTSRAIASVDSEKKTRKVDVDPKMIEDYKNSLLNKAEAKKVVTNKSSTTKLGKKKGASEKMAIIIYGQTSRPAIAITNEVIRSAMKSRAPASVADEGVLKNSKDVPVISPYSENYGKNYNDQNKESNKLINDLKKL